MKKILIFLFLSLCVPAAFADSSNILHPDAINNFTDMSVNYLSQIFGTVGGVLEGSGSQMMGKVFYVLNNGILIASVVVIMYSVLFSTVRLASEGVSISQGKSTLFSVLKLAIGIALIIPSPSAGYSALQSIVMRVVVEGVGLADSVWDHGLDYLQKGGLMWSAPKEGQTHSQANLVKPEYIKAMFDKDNKMASQVFANEVCMYGSRDLTNNSSGNISNPDVATGISRPAYSVWVDEKNHTFNFPGLNDSSATAGAACGSISWNVQNACDGKSDSDCATARQAVSSLVMNMLPLAQKYYCSQGNTQSETCRGIADASNDYAYSVLFNGMLQYFSDMQVYAEIHGKSAGSKADFIKGAKEEGWLNAGRYYWDLMRFTAVSQEASDLGKYVTSATAPNDSELARTSIKDVVSSAPAKIAGAEGSYILNASGNVTQGFQDYVNQVYGRLSSGNDDQHVDWNTGTIMSPVVGAAIAPTYFVAGVGATLSTAEIGLDVIGLKFNDPGHNPIQFLYELGQACLKLTISIWVIGGVLIGASMVGLGICQASSPLAAAGQTFVSWFQPLITMIATLLWISGFFLSYYVPLYPFMIFLFASVGWFISVIEAMVAAPLVALGLTHPENHDFLGKAEQAVVLLLGVFIQPSLLVIGLIAGIIFSFVSFQLLIYSYSGFMVDIMGSSATSSHSNNILGSALNSPLYQHLIILTQPLLLVVFCMLAYTLLTQSFSLVFLLRDNVMRWIGAPSSGLASPEQLVGETRSAISGMGRSSGDAVGQGISAGNQSLGQMGKDIGEQQKEALAATVGG